MNFLTLLLVIVSVAWICLTSNSRAQKSSKLPPGPYPLPIIGNILNLGPRPNQTLAKLSRKYGPVMSLKLGSITTVVVSSAEAAKVVYQKHDLALSSRTIPSAVAPLKHSEFSVAWLPVGNQWRKLRKICKEQMFSASRLDASKGLRREKLQKLCEYVKDCGRRGRAVNIGEAAFTTTVNLMSASLFSVEFVQFDSESLQEIKDVIWQVMKWSGKPNFADYFPSLKQADPLGIVKQSEIYFGKLFAILDGIINERLESRGEKMNDFVEALIDLSQRDESQLTRNDIIHLLMDLIVAGTETTSSSVEWAMTELLRHPEKLRRVRDEISSIIGEEDGGVIQESDISGLTYLQAVVKEAFRLHPPLPFLLPHKAERDVEINGYVVPRGAQILINQWASGRDPSFWTDADSFLPERFMDFELIPFGAGRRICPGLPLAHRMVHLMVAALVGNFGWKLEQEIDMEEMFGLSLQKATPVMAIPVIL